MKKRVSDETGKQKEPAEQSKALVEEGKAELIGACYQTLQEAVGGRGELASYIALKAACAIDSQDQVKAVQIALETLDEQKPKDAVEARLIAQAMALYKNGMDCLAKADITDRVDFMSAYGNIAIKYMRLHNETIEALGRYRRGGEQRVTVVHVAEKMAVVNNYGGGGMPQNQGDKPCP